VLRPSTKFGLKHVSWSMLSIFVISSVFPAIPIDENQVHRELVRKENVHKKERRQMKNYAEAEHPPTQSSPENNQRKQQFPDQDKANRKRQVSLHLRQPKRELEVRVVQVVQ